MPLDRNLKFLEIQKNSRCCPRHWRNRVSSKDRLNRSGPKCDERHERQLHNYQELHTRLSGTQHWGQLGHATARALAHFAVRRRRVLAIVSNWVNCAGFFGQGDQTTKPISKVFTILERGFQVLRRVFLDIAFGY